MGVISALKGASKVYQGSGVGVNVSMGTAVSDGSIVFRLRFSVCLAWETDGRWLHPAITRMEDAIQIIVMKTGTLNRFNSIFNVPVVFFMFCQRKLAVTYIESAMIQIIASTLSGMTPSALILFGGFLIIYRKQLLRASEAWQ
jgi:hypothetical protein